MGLCENCGFVKILDEGRDAYLCFYCNEWKESKCSDSECCFCVGRPDKPLKEKQQMDIAIELSDKYNDDFSMKDLNDIVLKHLDK